MNPNKTSILLTNPGTDIGCLFFVHFMNLSSSFFLFLTPRNDIFFSLSNRLSKKFVSAFFCVCYSQGTEAWWCGLIHMLCRRSVARSSCSEIWLARPRLWRTTNPSHSMIFAVPLFFCCCFLSHSCLGDVSFYPSFLSFSCQNNSLSVIFWEMSPSSVCQSTECVGFSHFSV